MKVGVLGGGQLALMLAQSGVSSVDRCVVWDPVYDACAQTVADHVQAPYDDPRALEAFLSQVDVVTWEFENVPTKVLNQIVESSTPVYPAVSLLAISQDRLKEKDYFQSIGVQTASYIYISTVAELPKAVSDVGFPFILKSRRDGYDGKSQYRFESQEDLDTFDQSLFTPSIAEGFVNFDEEVSIIAARDQSGTIVTYDLVQNTHKNGILHVSKVVPNHPSESKAIEIVAKVLKDHAYVGVFTIEFFVCGSDLIVNECAPRVHNSGHWTIEGAKTSQFANHMRCVTGLPCGETTTIGHPSMTNIIGEAIPGWAEASEDVYCHWYGKTIKPGRKCGHLTTL